MAKETSIGLVKGSNPEKFVIVEADSSKGLVTQMWFLPEKELRENMTKMGRSEAEIERKRTAVAH